MMDDRIPSGSYFQYSPSGVHASPHRPSSASLDRESSGRYLIELLAERQKLGPFMQVLPLYGRLLNQEIVEASGLIPNQSFLDHERIEHASPLRSTVQHPNGGPMDLEGWPVMQTEESGLLQRMGTFQASPLGWHGAPGVPRSPVLKKVIRLDVPVDNFPNEENLRDKPGYEHLNQPLHVLVDAEFPAEIIDSRLNQAVAILEDLLKPVGFDGKLAFLLPLGLDKFLEVSSPLGPILLAQCTKGELTSFNAMESQPDVAIRFLEYYNGDSNFSKN